MSPEQASGVHADEQSDVWALGVVLYEMLAGVRPFRAGDVDATIGQVLAAEPDLEVIGRAGSGIRAVVPRCLSRDRATRFANGGQVLAALEEAGLVPGAAASGRRQPARGARLAATTVTLLAVLVLAVLLWRRTSHAAARVPGAAPVARVLWVDDDPTNNRFILEQFTRRGVEVTNALNTREALDRYDPARYDLVISDMGRYEGPDGAYVQRTGLELLTALWARNQAVRVVFCTSARAATEFREEALRAGARDILTESEAILRMLGIEPRSPG